MKKGKVVCRIQPIKGHHQNLHEPVSLFSLEDPTIAQSERKKTEFMDGYERFQSGPNRGCSGSSGFLVKMIKNGDRHIVVSEVLRGIRVC